MPAKPAEGNSIPINRIIAHNIRAVRESRKLSLDAVAQLTGVSKSMLAQIERADVSPTITTVWKLANGLKIPFTELVSAAEESTEVVRASTLTPLLEDEGRFRNFPLFGFSAERPLELYRIELDAGCTMQAEAHPPETEELLTVCDGALTVQVHDETLRLARGDALRFRADVRHLYANEGPGPCSVTMVIYYGAKRKDEYHVTHKDSPSV